MHSLVTSWPSQDQDIRSLQSFFALDNYSVIAGLTLSLPRLPALPTRLQYDCNTIAQHTTLPPILVLYAIHHTILVMPTPCTGQDTKHTQSNAITGQVLDF